MEIAVSEAAERLGVHASRVRQLIEDGSLPARKVGSVWMVDADDVVHRLQKPRRAGRPLSARRAWALLLLLDGGKVRWASSKERSQSRQAMRHLAGGDLEDWRSSLIARDVLHPVGGHPAAVRRLLSTQGVMPVAPEATFDAGFDLVAVGENVPEVYLPAGRWVDLREQLRLRPIFGSPAVRVRAVPDDVWHQLLPDWGNPGPAVLAANLLDSLEPREVAAGLERLNDLAVRYEPPRGPYKKRDSGES